ncbi:putative ABC transport system permease protein [Pseudoalteromonas ulvae UL12]|uniref:FtsX-like permease family protein n=1 Tax=Pseudoalteromonas ulvae TaxID=107327 RepID=UPI00186B65B0|nr:FtsX-like permease family protein [Pseudoalteromonas ulvae]MBE0365794.1 putative ABC transport system permease protein [Pseudoalteromonas ulvae UL12]
MAEVSLILRTHIAYFRRHPWLLVLFIAGLSLGSALLTAIAGLNQEAKNRHHHSSALIDAAVSHIIKPPIGQEFISGQLWLTLRSQGFINAQPVLRGKLKLASGKTVYLQGIDSLMWLTHPAPSTTQHRQKSSTGMAFDSILIDRKQSKKLALTTVQPTLKLANNEATPHYRLIDNIGIWSITDIAYADKLLNAQGQLSFIEMIGLTPEQIPQIEAILANKARLVAAQEQNFDALSEAFFFNLGALALLGYIVAAFLSFNAIKLSIAGRKKLLEQFAILGCTPHAIGTAIAIEFILMSLVTALFGSIAGFVIANALVFDVNRTLMGLYQLEQALTIRWQWHTFLLGFVVNLGTLAFMLLTQKNPLKANSNVVFYGSVAAVLAAIVYFYNQALSELDALLLCVFILGLFVLVTPRCLQGLLSVRNPFKQPLWQWLYADSKLQLQELRIAIVAILVALGSAIGMQIMVKSFSNTLNAHLEKQLSADVYIHVDTFDPALRARLSTEPQIKQVGIYMASAGYLNKVPARLASFGQSHQSFAHINLTSGEAINAAHFANQGCIANEQAAIKYGYKLGDTVTFLQNQQGFACRISAFAYDYGNTALGLITQEQRLKTSSLHWQVFGLSLTLNEGASVEALTEQLINDYHIDSSFITENKRFKAIANQLFNDTFQVTKILNGFILAIALVSLCISLLSLSAQHGKQLIVLHNLGVDARQLHTLKLVQTSILVGFTCLFAIPLGFALGVALLKFVMPIAFGWTIHLTLDWPALLTTCALLLLAAVLCAYLPVKKLTRHLHAKGNES